MRRVGAKKVFLATSPVAIAMAAVAIAFLRLEPLGEGGRTASGMSSLTSVHFWISNQSLGTGVPALNMSVEVDDVNIFDRSMEVGTQHNVAFVDRQLPLGVHTVKTTVPLQALGRAGEMAEKAQDVSIDKELWILVRFWYDPNSSHLNQRTPTVTVDIFDKPPGIK